jgi:enolase
MKIIQIKAQEILDSRGNPTIETEVRLDSGVKGNGAVPSGASTGTYEAHELRDGDQERYLGKGVLKAVTNVNVVLAPVLVGTDASKQTQIDQMMLELDGTENKSKLGANAVLSISIAVLRAAAAEKKIPTYQYVAELASKPTESFTMPIPMMNVLNGGKHAAKSSDMQEYMIMPIRAGSIAEAVRMGSEIFHHLGKNLKAAGFSTSVGDEGGYAPPLGTNEGPLEAIMQAIDSAGYEPGKDVAIALDPAANEFFVDGSYHLKSEGEVLTSSELVLKYIGWLEKYPIISIEDGFAEDDWEGFAQLTAHTGNKVQVMGDDLFVTNKKRLQKGIEQKTANSILIKLNQIGTVSETISTMQLAEKNGFTSVVSHRSGETEDAFIADFVVGMGSGQIKTGSLSRSERIAKYNQLMRIERELGSKAQFASFPFDI